MYNNLCKHIFCTFGSLCKEVIHAGCPALDRDIIFVIDGSGSVGRENLKLIKNWIIELSSNFNINDGTNRIGIIHYSHYFEGTLVNFKYKISIILSPYTK